MSSWKQYGGLNKNDKMNNITATSIVTDTFTVRQGFLNTFVVDGDLKVYGTIYTNNLDVSAGGTIATDYITVRKNAIISDKLNFNTINDVYMKGSSGKIGINTATPSSTLDIVSFDNTQQSILNVYANNIANRNILARNNLNNGIALYANNTSSTLQFYSNSNITSTTAVNASITHTPGVLQLNASGGYTRIYNRLAVSVPPRDASAQVLNETAVIYDISFGTYFNNIYSKPLVKTGNALTLVSNDNSSNTFLNIVGPSGNGFKIGGGAFPLDISRNMGVLTLNSNTTPSQIFVSGNSSVKTHSTVGFNTFSPKIDSFAVDINGPVHINNGEITIVSSVPFQINRARGWKENPLYGIALGSSSSTTVSDFKIAYTTNGGVSWNLSSPSITNLSNVYQFRSCYVYDALNSIIVAESATAFYSNTSGSSWNQISIAAPSADTSFNDVYISKTGIGFVVYKTGYTYFTMSFSTGVSGAVSVVSVDTNFDITGVDGSGSTVFLVGENKILKINTTAPGVIVSTYTASSSANYNSVNVYDNYAVAVGANIISYTSNNGSLWTDISISDRLTNVLVYNATTAIAVGDFGAVYITRYGLNNWNKVDNNMFNSSGTSSLIINTQNLTGVYLSDPNTIIISKIISNYSSGSIQGSSYLFNLYTPYFANNTNNNVFDVCGNMRISGDLYVNDFGRIESNNTDFELLNRNIYNSLSIGGNAKTVSIGANNSVVQILNRFKTNGDASFNSNLYLFGNTITSGNVVINSKIQSGSVNSGALLVDGGAGITGNVFIGGNINIKGTLDAGSINISGATIGDDVSFNKTVYVKGAAAFGDDIYQLDGKYNINIAAASLGTFPNYGGTAVGPNLINIGSGNYNVVAGGLKDSIAIGNLITSSYSANSGYGIIGLGKNVFPLLTTGFQNIGIGNTIATGMITGYNNVFIGNGVATSTISTGNTVAIGTAAGKTNTTGINNTYLGAFTDATGSAYNNSTALGYGAQITKSNQIKLGTAAETVDISGNLSLSLDASFNKTVYVKGAAAFGDDIYQLDGKYNINIAAASLGTFPNYGGTAIGPNLINIGSGNYNVVAGGLKDSIAIGNLITSSYAANSGYGIIGLGKNVFPLLTTGFQNIGIGNTIATGMITGYNNVFIGNGVATSTISTGNTVAIGTAAGITNTTGINNTYLGAFTDANGIAYNNSTALGYGAQITKSNQIKLGTAAETVDVSGFMNITGNVKCNGVISDNKDLTTREYVDYEILTKGGTILLGSANTWTNSNTFKSNIYQIDNSYNINIAAASLGTFPNYGGTAVGPNLINIGSGNYNVVAGGLKDSIAIGNSITTVYAANSGYGIVGLGKNVFPLLTTGFQNTGIGNTIATSMITGYNNVFIGNGVATSTTSTGNTVAIGTAAGKTNTTGINNTYLGAFTDANSTTYNNSTALGYGAQITKSNQIKLGTAAETVDVSGNLSLSLDASFNKTVYVKGVAAFGDNIYQLDSKYNINIAAASLGTFPNYNGSAVGPNLINIGSGNYNAVAGGLKDSIAIGNTITAAYAANSGYGIVGLGKNVFPLLTTGFQNTGIGNTIATSMITGYNNVFIGNGVATSTTSTGNTVAIGTAAGKTNTTGINNTYLGAFTDANSTTYNNSTALGYGAQITKSNQIKLGTAAETVDVSGFMNITGNVKCTGVISDNKDLTTREYVDYEILTKGGTILLGSANTWTNNNTFKSNIYQIDSSYNINIAAASLGTFPNYGGTAIGPNLINIGSGNYNVVAGGLKDSIAIGNTITTAYAANSGYGIIGIGENIFTSLTTGFQNIGIGNTIATGMITGYNNVFIGNDVATSTTSTGNTVAIGTAAGKTNTTGINNTYLGAFTDANSTAYNNSTALGYGSTITTSNQIKLGTISERVDVSGNLNVYGAINSVITDPTKRTTVPFAIGSSGTYPNTTAISSPLVINGISSGTGDGANTSTFNLGIFSFNGIGFVDTQGNACKASIAVRTGIYTGVSFNATSDYRIKKNVIGLTDKYIVDKLKPVKYFNELSKRDDIGFIAHEVQEQFAELVSGEKDGDDNQSINYNGLIAISIHEIKQLKQKIAELEQIVKNSK